MVETLASNRLRLRYTPVLLGVSLLALSPAAAEPAEPINTVVSPRILGILLTVSPQLSNISRAELIAEATQLWGKAGITLTWTDGSDRGPDSKPALRVLVIPRRSGVRETRHRHVLGELLGVGRPGALVVASIDRAETLVNGWRGPAIVPQSLHDRQLGLVLGRVVAHEIGHYLLGIEHARDGLMRASFDPPELIDRRTSAFDLDAGAAKRLKAPAEAPQLSQR